MRNRNPEEIAELKKALDAQREAEKIARFENMDPAELMRQQRAAERRDEGLTKLETSDLELLTDEPAETPVEKAGIRMAQHAGSERAPVIAETEHKAVDASVLRERALRKGEKMVDDFIKSGKDTEILRARLEAELESAENTLEDLDEDQDNLRANAQLAIDVASAKLQHLDYRLAGNPEKNSEEVA